jgi:hypothetical protein
VSPVNSYGRLLALAGPGYVVVAFLGRLPLAMSQLGSLLLVSSATGRYAVAATVGRLRGRGGGHRGAFAVAVTAGGLAFVLAAGSASRFAAAGLRTPDLVPDSRALCVVSRQPHKRSTSNA